MASVIDKAVKWAKNIANDNSHGYDQNSRWGPDYDCSSFVISAYEHAGAKVKTKGASYTTNMRSVFLKCGFKDVTSKVKLSSGSGLKKGDVLLNTSNHTALALSSKQIIHASINENGNTKGGSEGDQTGKEICIRSYYNHPWNYILRYSESSSSSSSSSQNDITSEKTMMSYGQQMEARQNQFSGRKNSDINTPEIELYIINWGGKIYKPIVEEGIEWETTYSGSPAQLTFTIIKDENIGFYEGSQVIFKYQGAPIFYGFVFKKTRDKEHKIKCTCYDQMRYLQNKNSMVYSNKTATELIEMIAKDFSLNVGSMINTETKIPLRVEDNASLFDIIQYALDYTTWKTGTWYTFYDDFGKLTLKKSVDMKSNCIIAKDNAENFDYESSINESTYTRIKYYYDDKDSGTRQVYTYDESAKRPYYGVLQLCEKIEEENIESFKANAEAQMKYELEQYSAPTRSLSIKGALGDVMVRGGSIVYVSLNLGDIIVNSQKSGHYFVCDSVKHNFKNGLHTMDLNLTGGGYRFL